jgi:hypothetical protein
MALVPSSKLPFLAWPLVLGAAGFTAGFFGPIAFLPDANTGPLIGIFMTGPGGVVLGLIMGAVVRTTGLANGAGWKLLVGTAVIGWLAIMAFCIVSPTPIYRGAVIEGTLTRCVAPMELAPEAILDWENRIAKVTWTPPRQGWKESVPSLLSEDTGAVLEITIARENPVYEQRKLWNKGEMRAQGWQTPQTSVKRFYARHSGKRCTDYQLNEKAQFYPIDETSSDWPPSTAPIFLGLLLLKPVPEAIAKQL